MQTIVEEKENQSVQTSK